MITKDRMLVIVLIGFLGLVGLGFITYQFIIEPMGKLNEQIVTLGGEVSQKELELLEIQMDKEKFKAIKQMSLPGDVNISRGTYSRLLKSLLERSGLPAGSFKLVVSEADSKSAPVVEGKKTAYTRLSYEISAKGELYYFVEFLKHFYDQPMLHMIKKINIQRPSDSKAQAKAELDVVINVEAIVLDNAADRGTLYAAIPQATAIAGGLGSTGMALHSYESGRGSPIALAGSLAEPHRDYQSISMKNIFFGPAPVIKPPPETPDSVDPEDDISKFITLTSVVGHPQDGLLVAVFRDKLNNHEYTVTQTESGKISVDATYDLNGRKKTIYKAGGQQIIYGSDAGQNKRVFRVRRINAADVIVEEIYEDKEKAKEKATFPLMVAGGLWSAVHLNEKFCSVVSIGNSFDGLSPLTSREAFKAIYAKPSVLAVSSDEDPGR
ncbi:hypothetical protein [Zavarzinella formosa]|uniref:hypothetical protein n=1 Tax=Zavarzinella formosa TaxID=360055 RepID=UPI0002D66D62|nr:hypothetical protein [Zavarzinella formosa]